MVLVYGEHEIMPDTLKIEPTNIEDYSNDREINRVVFEKSYVGVSSQVITINVRNQSTTGYFEGQAMISVAEDNSRSNDSYISDDGISWDKEIDLLIPSGKVSPIMLKVIPSESPSYELGKATVGFKGSWKTGSDV
jgi:hypothetical protein